MSVQSARDISIDILLHTLDAQYVEFRKLALVGRVVPVVPILIGTGAIAGVGY